MVSAISRLPPGLRAAEPIELILLVAALTAGVLVWAVASTLSRQRAASLAAGDEATQSQAEREEATYVKLRNRYISVYALATFGDWIQGGYLYALYAEYGFSMREIALIFVAGYGSAATLGTYVGGAPRAPRPAPRAPRPAPRAPRPAPRCC